MASIAKPEGSSASGSRGKGARHFPYPEYVRRRDEGRCYHCGLAFGSGHKCPEKSLRLVILTEDEQLNDEGEIVYREPQEDDADTEKGEPEATCQRLDLLLCSDGGLTQPQTMKLRGKVQGGTVVILIDSGASHNFISTKLVQRLGLKVDPTVTYKVRLGDGHGKQTQGCCRQLGVQLGTYAFTGEFFVSELGGVDVILGVAWLATLGDVKVNWRTLTMTSLNHGSAVEVKGDSSLAKTLISPKALLKVSEVETASLLWVVKISGKTDQQRETSELTEGQQVQLQQVLHEFEWVFAVPEGLPPNREVDHRIPIKAGIDPVNVRPYRYPHLQKNEIEKLVCRPLE